MHSKSMERIIDLKYLAAMRLGQMVSGNQGE